MQSKTPRKVKRKPVKKVTRENAPAVAPVPAPAKDPVAYDLLSLLEIEFDKNFPDMTLQGKLITGIVLDFSRDFLQKNPPIGTYIVGEGLGIKLSTKENGVISLPLVKLDKESFDMQGPPQYLPLSNPGGGGMAPCPSTPIFGGDHYPPGCK